MIKQTILLNQDDIYTEIASSEGEKINESPQGPVKPEISIVSPDFSLAEIPETNSPPPYTPFYSNDIINTLTETENQVNAIDNEPKFPTLPNNDYIPTPVISSKCDKCSIKSSYFDSLSDSSNWLAIAFQLVNSIFGLSVFIIVSFMFLFSIGALIVLPMGLIFVWISSALARFFVFVQIKSFSMIRSRKECCINCRSYSSTKNIIPDVVYKPNDKRGFFSTLYSPLKDSYTWLSFAYITLINPFTAIIGSALTFTGLFLGIMIFPTLPFSFRLIRRYSVWQRNSTLEFLRIKKS
ncbi:hypothetical protein AYI68_g4296 [Smittium mucronatum]|uniref:Uncharacterized protein n=1 Tax=Smittium mucronatum TaxID=133383 RepID=A0A1R0GXH5_9FUNG|nr:hypothetical protein AYI68_g4296 [Smittium mucronatum]